jgi:hypothetical protein
MQQEMITDKVSSACLPSSHHYRPLLSVGNLVDAKDSLGAWYQSRIVKRQDNSRVYLIHFEGYDDKWDEWVSRDNIRPVGTKTALGRQPGQRLPRAGDVVFDKYAVKNTMADTGHAEKTIITRVSERLIVVEPPQHGTAGFLVAPFGDHFIHANDNSHKYNVHKEWVDQLQFSDLFADVVVELVHEVSLTSSINHDTQCEASDGLQTQCEASGSKSYWSRAVHRLVLYNHSAYFRAAFNEKWEYPHDEKGRQVITVYFDTTDESLEFLFRYMYLGDLSTVDLLLSDLPKLVDAWHVTDFFQVESLSSVFASAFQNKCIDASGQELLELYRITSERGITNDTLYGCLLEQITMLYLDAAESAKDPGSKKNNLQITHMLQNVSYDLLCQLLQFNAHHTNNCHEEQNDETEMLEWLLWWKSLHPETCWKEFESLLLEHFLRVSHE